MFTLASSGGLCRGRSESSTVAALSGWPGSSCTIPRNEQVSLVCAHKQAHRNTPGRMRIRSRFFTLAPLRDEMVASDGGSPAARVIGSVYWGCAGGSLLEPPKLSGEPGLGRVNLEMRYHLRYGRNFPLYVTTTRSPLGSSFFWMSSSKSMALMMPSPNISWMIALMVVP